jgi:hypothetical protein
VVLVGDREEKISVDRLKPHLGLAPQEVARPPRRGRLPGQPPLHGSGGSGG